MLSRTGQQLEVESKADFTDCEEHYEDDFETESTADTVELESQGELEDNDPQQPSQEELNRQQELRAAQLEQFKEKDHLQKSLIQALEHIQHLEAALKTSAVGQNYLLMRLEQMHGQVYGLSNALKFEVAKNLKLNNQLNEQFQLEQETYREKVKLETALGNLSKRSYAQHQTIVALKTGIDDLIKDNDKLEADVAKKDAKIEDLKNRERFLLSSTRALMSRLNKGTPAATLKVLDCAASQTEPDAESQTIQPAIVRPLSPTPESNSDSDCDEDVRQEPARLSPG